MQVKINNEWYDVADFDSYEDMEQLGEIEETNDIPDSLNIKQWFNEIIEASELDQTNLNILEAWYECTNDYDIRNAHDNLIGKYNSIEEFARQYVTDSGDLTHTPLYIVNCIDWQMLGQDLMADFVEHNGFYFTNN